MKYLKYVLWALISLVLLSVLLAGFIFAQANLHQVELNLIYTSLNLSVASLIGILIVAGIFIGYSADIFVRSLKNRELIRLRKNLAKAEKNKATKIIKV